MQFKTGCDASAGITRIRSAGRKLTASLSAWHYQAPRAVTDRLSLKSLNNYFRSITLVIEFVKVGVTILSKMLEKV
jgi:hypothetical protein